MLDLRKLIWLLGQVAPSELAARLRLKAIEKLSGSWRPRVPANLEAERIFTAPAARDTLVEAFRNAGLVEETAAEARKILEGRFTLFGGLEHRAERGFPDWHAAWPTGARWGGGRSFEIDFSGADGRDIRYTWELSRHAALLTLARAAFLTGRSAFSERLDALLADWIEANPLLFGPNWISALEAAMRAVAWSFIDDASPPVDSSLRRRFHEALFLHGAFIERFMSRGLNPSNHIIGEATALFILGGKFCSTPSGRRWHATARLVLEREMRRQVYPSGASREHSTNYHRFVTKLFSLSLAVSGRDEFSEGFKSRLGDMYAFLGHLGRRDGSCSDIGDSDNADALGLSSGAAGTLAGDLALGAALLPDAEIPSACVPRAPSPEVLWLLGPGAAVGKPSPTHPTHPTHPTPPAPASTAFDDVGLVIMRSPSSALQVEFDRGPQGYGRVSSHGHADALSLAVWHGGDRLIDPGTYRYNAARTERDAFRSSTFHNTLTVDSASQARCATPFRWLTLADAVPAGDFLSRDFDWARGVLDFGPMRPWRHEREVIRVGESALIVIDSVFCPGRHEATAYFHLGDARPTVNGRCVVAEYADGGVMMLSAGAHDAVLEVFGPGEQGHSWRSMHYGERSPSALVRVRLPFSDALRAPWVILFERGAAVTQLDPDRGKAVVMEIATPSGDWVFICQEMFGIMHFRDIRFIGRWALLEMEKTRVAGALAGDVWALEQAGERIFTRFGGEKIAVIPREA